MAISLFCYSSLLPEETQGILDLINNRHPEIFKERCLIFRARDLRGADNLRDADSYYHSVLIDIALEHGLKATCLFLVAINDKSAVGLISRVVEIIKTALGECNVVILFNNEGRL